MFQETSSQKRCFSKALWLPLLWFISDSLSRTFQCSLYMQGDPLPSPHPSSQSMTMAEKELWQKSETFLDLFLGICISVTIFIDSSLAKKRFLVHKCFTTYSLDNRDGCLFVYVFLLHIVPESTSVFCSFKELIFMYVMN